MPRTWKSSEDAMRDLALINDFGSTNEEVLKADLTKDKMRCTENREYRFVDPRTGEEIDIRSESRLIGLEANGKCASIGRGKLIEEFRHSSKTKKLQKQLRMNRPLGFGNNMIESYFNNRKDTEEAPPTTSSEADPAPKTVVIGKRKDTRRNVLISSLLERMEGNGDITGGNLVLNDIDWPALGGKKNNSNVKT